MRRKIPIITVRQLCLNFTLVYFYSLFRISCCQRSIIMTARRRLDSGISISSSWSEKHDPFNGSELFENNALFLKSKDTGGLDFKKSAKLHDDIKDDQFEKLKEKSCRQRDNNNVSAETHLQSSFESDNSDKVADDSQDTEAKQVNDNYCVKQVILKPTNSDKKDTFSRDVRKYKQFEDTNKTVKTEVETKLDCELTDQTCDWHRFRNDSVYPDRNISLHTYSHLSSSLTVPYKLCNVPSTINNGCIDVTRRCDDLLNELQQLTFKYAGIKETYQKLRKLFYILAVLNLILMMCMLINLPVLIARLGSWRSNSADTGDTAIRDNESAHGEGTICFNCSDLDSDTAYSLETVNEVRQENGICCFQSIVSVLRSIRRNVQTTIEESIQYIKKALATMDRRLLELEAGSIPDSSHVIGRILQALSPTEKSVVYLRSVKDTPIVMEPTFTGKYNKLKWDREDAFTILTDGVNLSKNGLNIVVKSEGYYFIYTQIQFRKRKKFTYQNVPLSYLIYRKRGSTSTYVHEAKLNCVFNGKTQEHSSNSEMVLHLNRDDEIFLSVADLDKDFLSMDPGVHSIGLFEL